MAPPKRKTGGRVTEKGTRPSLTRKSSNAAGATASSRRLATGSTSSTSHSSTSSSRYTPPVPIEMQHSRPWVPFLMLGFLVLGGVMIMLRYLVWTGTTANIPLIIGLTLILAGLYTATKWR